MFKNYRFNPNPYGVHKKILNLISPGNKIFEIGCSTGYLSKELKDKGSQVYAIEIDREAAKIAQNFCTDIIIGNIEETEMFPQSFNDFDVILLADVLEHLIYPEKVLIKLKHYLKPNGIFIVSLPNIANWRIRKRILSGVFEYDDSGIMDRSHFRFYTLKTSRELLNSNGLLIIKFDVIPGFDEIARFNQIIHKHFNKYDIYNRLIYKICKRYPELFAKQFLFACQNNVIQAH